jgi:hypothetical protein
MSEYPWIHRSLSPFQTSQFLSHLVESITGICFCLFPLELLCQGKMVRHYNQMTMKGTLGILWDFYANKEELKNLMLILLLFYLKWILIILCTKGMWIM